MSRGLEEYTKEELLAYISKLKKDVKFGLVWNPKDEQVAIDCETKIPVLQAVADRTIAKASEDEPTHLLIEGDNYHSLSVLNYTHAGRVDVIYIDPPYNTGNKDFIYNDRYVDKEDPYRHSEWLSFMDNRLRLAKNLLSDTGVMFISIDDNEQAHLKILCDTIFGEENFIAQIVRNTNSSKNQSLYISVSHEYCLVYSKNADALNAKHTNNKWGVLKNNIDEYKKRVIRLKKEGLSNDEITDELKNLTNYPRFIDFTNYWYLDDKGLYRKDNLGGVKDGNLTPLFNPLTGKDDPIPPGGYRYNPDKLAKLVAENRIHFHSDGRSLPTLKRYLDENSSQRPKSIMSDDQRPDYSLLKAMNVEFDNPKQMAFMNRILSIADKDAIILDFFAGSGTTGHSVLELNSLDGGSRKFIMCTNNENNIAEDITYERINQVINGYNSTNGIAANLRYFKTDFVETNGLNTLSDKERLEITKEMGAMIALRENSFKQLEQTDHWQTYENATQLTAVYFREDKTHIQDYLDKLNSQDKPVKLYVFGWGKNAGTEYASKKISVEDIPEPLIEVYKEIAK